MQKGDRLGHFEIRGKLGSGGMGEVFLAEDTRLGRKVAIKILPASVAKDPGRRSRFDREARAASALSHPNIAHIYDVGEEGGVHFIAMEYVDGEDLGKHLAGGSLPQAKIIDVAVQVAGALEQAREKGIIHRDIKPANIALTSRGEVKVLDFGLAKMTGGRESGSTDSTMTQGQTAAGAVLGTVRYMSPEQALGKVVDTRSDLFSMGVVLYEMVAGRPPFAESGKMSILEAIIQRPPEPLARLNYEVAPELERIILKCLEKDPDHRYQTPRDLLVDLKNLQRNSDTGATVVMESSTSAVPAGGRKLVPWIAGLAVVAVVVAAYFLVPRAGADVESLAVLPFVNETGDPEVDYLCNGVTESLINTMSRYPDLRVISRRSAFALDTEEMDPETAGKKLGVDVLLFGRVVQRGEKLTISTELVDARDSRQMWGARYDRQINDILSIENEITGTIAKTLKVELEGTHEELLPVNLDTDSKAYRLYLRGRDFTTGNMVEMDKAILFLQEAIELEPDFALAYAGLAQAYTRQCYTRGSERDGTVELARNAAQKAMELDPGLAEAYTSRGLLKLYFDLDWKGAEKDLLKGVELGSGRVLPVMTMGDFYLFMGDFEKAVKYHERAEELDPLSIGPAHDLGFTYMCMQEYELAEAQFRRALDLSPSWTWGHIKLAKTLAHMGRCEEALAENEIAEALHTGSATPAAISWMSFTYALCGETEKAAAGLDDLQNRSGTEYVDPAVVAIIQLGLGDLEGAIRSLEKSLEERSPNLVFYKLMPPLYMDELADDPRFQAMRKKIGLP